MSAKICNNLEIPENPEDQWKSDVCLEALRALGVPIDESATEVGFVFVDFEGRIDMWS